MCVTSDEVNCSKVQFVPESRGSGDKWFSTFDMLCTIQYSISEQFASISVKCEVACFFV